MCLFLYIKITPSETRPEECRTDICISPISKNVKLSGNIKLQPFKGGECFAVREVITDFSQYAELWDAIDETLELLDENSFNRYPCFELCYRYDPNHNVNDVLFCCTDRKFKINYVLNKALT